MRSTALAFVIFTLTLFGGGQTHTFPLERGTTWTYKGTVRWSIGAGAASNSKRIEWKVRVVQHATRGDTEAALLQGWPSDLAWYDEGTAPGDYLMVRDHDTYFLYVEKAKQEFQRFQMSKDYRPSPDRIFFREPLKVPARFCEPSQEQRTDTSYCWFVESRRSAKIAATGVPGGRLEVYTVVFRTNPEHELLDVHPGLGITHYEFHHHGTISDADVDLISYSADQK